MTLLDWVAKVLLLLWGPNVNAEKSVAVYQPAAMMTEKNFFFI